MIKSFEIPLIVAFIIVGNIEGSNNGLNTGEERSQYSLANEETGSNVYESAEDQEEVQPNDYGGSTKPKGNGSSIRSKGESNAKSKAQGKSNKPPSGQSKGAGVKGSNDSTKGQSTQVSSIGTQSSMYSSTNSAVNSKEKKIDAELAKAMETAEKNGCYDKPGMDLVVKKLNYSLLCLDAKRVPLTNGKMLGQGGFGKVYLAKDKDGSEFAVKESYFTHNKAPMLLTEINFMACFRNQQKVKTSNKSKTDHQGNVLWLKMCLYDVIDKNVTKIKILMPVAPRDLQDYIFEKSKPKRNKKFSLLTRREINDKLALMNGIAHGVKQIHDKGIIHRDLKTENVLLSKEGRAYIADLGLAEFDSGDKNKGKAGTPLYMAPELYKEYFYKGSDIYSLGLIFYAIILDRDPQYFVYEKDKENKDIIYRDFPREFRKFQVLIEAMLAKNPKDRPVINMVLNFIITFNKNRKGINLKNKNPYKLKKQTQQISRKLEANERALFLAHMRKKKSKTSKRLRMII